MGSGCALRPPAARARASVAAAWRAVWTLLRQSSFAACLTLLSRLGLRRRRPRQDALRAGGKAAIA